MDKLIFLDNGATSFPKPEEVYAYMDYFFRKFGVNPGRSGYDLCLEAGEIVEAAARDGVKFIATTDKGNVIQHPAVGVRNKAWERVVKLARQFGMTPSARAGMAIANAADEQRDPLLTLLHERMSRN